MTYLNAALKSGGVWNAARYANKKFDEAGGRLHRRERPAAQKKYAAQIQTAAAQDTPAIYAYFYNFIAGASPKVHGLRARRHRIGSTCAA